MGIRIKGIGKYVPERIMTNADLEKMVETNDEWIRTRTGIHQRHIAESSTATSDLAANAAKAALADAAMDASELDMILVATVTPDHTFPSTAALIQQKIGAPKCMSFDIEAACSGLLYGLDIAHSMIFSGKHRKVLVIGAEKLSSITDYTDRSTCVLFGDGASALILEADDSIEGDFYLGGEIGADGNYGDILQVPAGGSAIPASHDSVDRHLHFIHMDGPKTFQQAVTSMTRACRKVLEKTGVSPDQIRWVIPHQANQRIISAVAERLNLSDSVYCNVARYGNTSSASIGLCLDELHHSGQLQRGDLILMTAFGGGLTWAAELIRW